MRIRRLRRAHADRFCGLGWLLSAASVLLLEALLILNLGFGRVPAATLALACIGALYLPIERRANGRAAVHAAEQVHHETGIERRRIARDLHEDIGARLLQQLHTVRGEEPAAQTRRALHELRALIDTLDDRPFELAECVDEWRAQLQDLCESHGLVLRFRSRTALPRVRLAPAERGNPARILREFVDNAARHAQPAFVEVAVAVAGARLSLRALHDGATADPASWRGARGLRNMQLRADDLGGALHWRTAAPGTVEMKLAFALRNAD